MRYTLSGPVLKTSQSNILTSCEIVIVFRDDRKEQNAKHIEQRNTWRGDTSIDISFREVFCCYDDFHLSDNCLNDIFVCFSVLETVYACKCLEK